MKELNEIELREVNGGGFLKGLSDCFAGKPMADGGGFWYYVGYAVEVVAGGYNNGADLKHGQAL